MIELISGERQVAKKTERIRKDHLARYEFVRSRLDTGSVVVDAGCGVGYGSNMLAEAGSRVVAFDKSVESIGFARDHYGHDDVSYHVAELYDEDFAKQWSGADAVVAFEVIEHLADPRIALRNFGQIADTLYVSVPNEEKFPFRGHKFHTRHYTKQDLATLLADCGWKVVEWHGQDDAYSEVEEGVNGRTLVAVCKKVSEPVYGIDEIVHEDAELGRHLINNRVPDSVSILGMGPSLHHFVDVATKMGGRFAVSTEVWAVNALGGVISNDRVFHMDDFAIQQSRVAAKESALVAGMMKWMPYHPRVYTSRAYEKFPHAIEYPLEWVLNRVGVNPYFKGTPTYAVAMAIALGVKQINLFGIDYHYGNGDIKKREKGRACMEFWLGVAEARGIETKVSTHSTLFDMTEGGREDLYGYDTEWVKVEKSDRYRVSRVPRRPEDVPSAQDIAVRYSHDPKIDSQSRERPGAPEAAIVSPAQ